MSVPLKGLQLTRRECQELLLLYNVVFWESCLNLQKRDFYNGISCKTDVGAL